MPFIFAALWKYAEQTALRTTSQRISALSRASFCCSMISRSCSRTCSHHCMRAQHGHA